MALKEPPAPFIVFDKVSTESQASQQQAMLVALSCACGRTGWQPELRPMQKPSPNSGDQKVALTPTTSKASHQQAEQVPK